MEVLEQNDTHDSAVKCDVVILRQGGFDNQEGEDALSEKQHDPFTETMDTDCVKKSGREMAPEGKDFKRKVRACSDAKQLTQTHNQYSWGPI